MKRKNIQALSCVLAVALSASGLSACSTSSVPEATTASETENSQDAAEQNTDTENPEAPNGPDGAPMEEAPEGMPGGPGGQGGPGGPGGMPGPQETSTKVSVTEGDWSFDVITTGEGENKKVTSTITYYAGKEDAVVIIPSVLGGAPVTEISAQAFGHHSEIMAVYVPDTVTTVSEWAFYDLNTATIISFGNPDVNIDDAAFQSSGNAVLYLPEGTSQTKAGGKEVVSAGTELITVSLENPEAAAIAGGTYLNVSSDKTYSISTDDITAIAVSASGEGSDVSVSGSTVTFSGDAYVAEEEKVEIFEKFKDSVKEADLTKTLWYLSEDDAKELKEKIESDESYSKLKSVLKFEEGYYINGDKVTLDENVKAYDVKTGEEIEKDSITGAFPATGSGNYRYMSYEDTDNDGDVDIIYYSPYSVNYSYDSTVIKSDNENLNGLTARDTLNPIYLSFAESVVKASGESEDVKEDDLTIDTSKDGDAMGAEANEERSLVWADDYASITVDHLNGTSTASANWAKMSYLTGLSSYNVEIAMEWGMNALLYATNGGIVTVGSTDGEKSTFYANGDGANGVIAGGSGKKTGESDAKSDTASVYVYNADFTLEGWNNHVADVVYGGYAYLEDVTGTTGIDGSYSVGQASALANDFGNGVVDVKNFSATVFGNRSAGAYVIGGGVITAEDSSFISKADAAAVIASGGTYKMKNTLLEGVMGIKNRGGINTDSTSIFDNVTVRAAKNMSNYITGAKAKAAADAWEKASGSTELMHYMMSDADMTIGQLCDNYDVSDSAKKELLETLSEIAGETYTEDTKLRSSVLDNTYYNYSAGAYTGTTDYSDIPYLVVGSAYGGTVSSVMEFEAAGENLLFTNSKFENTNGDDYNYLIASEAGSAPVITFEDSDASGIIWNEGDIERVVEGMSGSRSSSVTVTFKNSDFTGSFADGSNGLWDVDGLSYTNSKGETTSLNGNYYGAESNFGISATFSGDSVWTVTHDSYLGSLTIEDSASITAPSGYKLTMTVDGKKTDIKAGTYTGKIVITLTKA
ncbi:hypothetical protein [Oribacterium sp. P6A1]|uniref:hypothetical protein n=1 Tax=Oribacterium sp. P6A1 TaxID=1410612 RepID=UPI00056C5D93|nr:hypothetical protein [Oribacterium sp. P6A1]